MYSRLLKIPLTTGKSFFLFGPRGTGKTTWIKKNIPDGVYIDLLNTDDYLALSVKPNRLEDRIPKNFFGWIIIDEVQKVPFLLNEVHRLIEEYKYKFILTGSSARSLRKKGVNLLAGRAATYHIYPLTVSELKDDFNLERSLQYGHLPSVFNEDPKIYLPSYINTYLREEVLQEGLTRNLAVFSRFLETASFSQASILNMSAVARDAGINQKVVASYFDILEDLLLGFRLFPFTKRAKRRMVIHPKFFFFDVGVYQTLRPRGPFDLPEEIAGPALETLFLQELRAINDYFQLGYKIYFWRTSKGEEVDFVVYGPKGIHAFEIKRSDKLNNIDLKNLKIFQKDFPEAKIYLLYGGKHTEYREDITVMPFVQALKNLLTIL
jgi:predicted AAA+ superfamily ATPase